MVVIVIVMVAAITVVVVVEKTMEGSRTALALTTVCRTSPTIREEATMGTSNRWSR